MKKLQIKVTTNRLADEHPERTVNSGDGGNSCSGGGGNGGGGGTDHS